MGGVGYYFLLDVEAMFRYAIPIDSFILGDDYLFKSAFVVHFFLKIVNFDKGRLGAQL